MGWEDRDYNTGNGGGGDYLSNPRAMLNFSMPFGTWFGVPVRLHLWLIVSVIFAIAGAGRAGPFHNTLIGIASMLAALLLHDFGHRWATQLVGGRHDEFMLWPAGGWAFPSAPPGNGAHFFVFAAGIAVNAVVAGICWLAVFIGWHDALPMLVSPMAALTVNVPIAARPTVLATTIATLAIANAFIVFVNLLPFYIFDGAYLLQAALGHFMSGLRASNVTCIVGMVLAGAMFLLSFLGGQFLIMIAWALLFYFTYRKRMEFVATGNTDFDDAIAYSARMGSGPEPLLRQRWGKRTGVSTQQLMKQAEADRREQGKIDTILAKVSAEGMQSLTRKERKVLSDATERQRKRAERR